MIALVYQQHNKCLQNILSELPWNKAKENVKISGVPALKRNLYRQVFGGQGGNKTNKRSANSSLNGCDIPDLEVKVEGKTMLYQF